MLSRPGQMRHQNKKVEQAARQYRDELLEESSQHAFVVHPPASLRDAGRSTLAVRR